MSNFVTPAWFDPLAPSSAQFDKLGLLHGPFTLLKGGYLVYGSAGKEHQKQGDEFPKWRTAMKAGPNSRTGLRRSQVEGFYADPAGSSDRSPTQTAAGATPPRRP